MISSKNIKNIMKIKIVQEKASREEVNRENFL